MSSVDAGQSRSEPAARSRTIDRVMAGVAVEETLEGAVRALLRGLEQEHLIEGGTLWRRSEEGSSWEVSLPRPVQGEGPPISQRQWELVERVVSTRQSQWTARDEEGTDAREGETPRACCVAFPVLVAQQVEGVVALEALGEAAEVERLLEVVPILAMQLSYIRKLEQLECQVATAAQRERERLGEAMHDGLGQQIAGIAMLAEAAARRFAEEPVGKELDLLASAASEARQQVRWLTRGLLPSEVDPAGLTHALEELATGTEACHSVRCTFETDGRFRPQDAATATQIYLIAKEAIHNAVKHAATERIVIRLDSEREGRLQVVDHGRGFEPQPGHNGHGLRIMRQRAAAMGWELSLAPGPHGGTIVTCSKGS